VQRCHFILRHVGGQHRTDHVHTCVANVQRGASLRVGFHAVGHIVHIIGGNFRIGGGAALVVYGYGERFALFELRGVLVGDDLHGQIGKRLQFALIGFQNADVVFERARNFVGGRVFACFELFPFALGRFAPQIVVKHHGYHRRFLRLDKGVLHMAARLHGRGFQVFVQTVYRAHFLAGIRIVIRTHAVHDAVFAIMLRHPNAVCARRAG